MRKILLAGVAAMIVGLGGCAREAGGAPDAVSRARGTPGVEECATPPSPPEPMVTAGGRRPRLADLTSVDAFVAGWAGPLHALVANAGIMALPYRRLSPHGWDLQLGTNYLGHFALARGLRDNLRAARGRG
ncbi:hypothetical protein AB0H57_23785 [Micromonospora sp. NPDC050686]|uniref:hypothetical protein n=1 Tax=Micromonospora sp. NPDC050686 TaxID=3154631 RepID=UPI0033ED62D6